MPHEVHQVQTHVPPVDKTRGLDKLAVELSTQQIKLYNSEMTMYLRYAIHANVSAEKQYYQTHYIDDIFNMSKITYF